MSIEPIKTGPKQDNVPVKAVFEGKRQDVDSGLAGVVETKLMGLTGLPPSDISFKQREFSVRLKPTKKGKDEYTGKSPESVEAAIADATQEGSLEFDQSKVSATVEQVAQVPYFTVRIVSRSLYPNGLTKSFENAVGELASTYGNRLNRRPVSVEYGVIKTKRRYGTDDKLPKGKEVPKVEHRGSSGISLTEATFLTKPIVTTIERLIVIVSCKITRCLLYNSFSCCLPTVNFTMYVNYKFKF